MYSTYNYIYTCIVAISQWSSSKCCINKSVVVFLVYCTLCTCIRVGPYVESMTFDIPVYNVHVCTAKQYPFHIGRVCIKLCVCSESFSQKHLLIGYCCNDYIVVVEQSTPVFVSNNIALAEISKYKTFGSSL